MSELPMCGVIGCANQADPRFHECATDGRPVMVCDGCAGRVVANELRPPCDPLSAAPSLNELARVISQLANAKGFRDNIKEPAGVEAVAVYCANLHGEVSELWEAARADKLDAPCDKAAKMHEFGIAPLACAEEELADILIRVLDTSGILGIDIEAAVRAKHAYNMTRPFRHGGKLV